MLLNNSKMFIDKIVENLMKLPAPQRRMAVREFHPDAQEKINQGLAARLVADLQIRGFKLW